ncbi:TetR family transcriptional regulator [Alkalibaculum sp. M08DMB]|uniref:TetR family transcriptional regulator n=1 Tax=Alkalibaculum sporogenes TaxID=2655001 RepID=A0A6A7K420_9FIRM|nr:TetR/AcrR family transcriptional regulator [Alkalibaculum sporogenes]MPW24212.1 TetR family transcriptional regulator [Alkalibaculum sporogenes]
MARHKAGVETKEKIYNTAEILFYENGYVDTKVTDIIDRSRTNKGSFYHHFENKADLGFSIFLDSVEEHYRSSQILELEDSLVKFSLEITIFWYTYFQDAKLRRFSSELNSNDIIYEHDRVYEVCLENTNKKIDDKEFSLIRVANVALYKQLTIYFYDQTQRYNFIEARNFYLKNLFELFAIPHKRREYVLKESLRLFETMDIVIHGFKVVATIRG